MCVDDPGTSTTSRRRRAPPGCAWRAGRDRRRQRPLRRRARRGRRVALARHVAAQPGLRFAGLQAYYGRAQHINEVEKRRAAIQTGIADVRHTVDLLKRQGLACELVSGAGTGSYRWEAASGVYNEVQAGSYCFMDVEYNLVEGFPREFRQSLFVLAAVMSRPVPERAVVDAGLKALSVDKGMPGVHGLAGVEFQRASDEHGVMKLEGAGQRLALGDRVWLVPGHCDPTINLYDWYVAVRGGRVEAHLADHRARRGPVSGPPRRTRSIAGQPVAWLEAGRAGRSSWCTARADPRSSGRGSSTSSPTWPSFVAPDLPGHGPLGGRGRPSIAAYAEWLDGFLDAVAGEPAVLVGHSMGGAVAQTLALLRPERLAGLVLIATGARLRVVARLVELLRHDPREGQSLIQDLSFGAPAPRECGELVARVLREGPPLVTLGDYLACDRFDVRDRLAAIRTPTLVVAGAEDRLTPLRYARFLAETIPGARLVEIRGRRALPAARAARAGERRHPGVPRGAARCGHGRPRGRTRVAMRTIRITRRRRRRAGRIRPPAHRPVAPDRARPPDPDRRRGRVRRLSRVLPGAGVPGPPLRGRPRRPGRGRPAGRRRGGPEPGERAAAVSGGFRGRQRDARLAVAEPLQLPEHRRQDRLHAMKKTGMRRGPLVVRPADHRGDFFRVLQETERSQTAVMTVAPGQDAGPEETHAADQILYVIDGQAEVRVGKELATAGPGTLVTIPAGTPHHVRSTGAVPLFFLTVYAPPEY